MEIFRFEDALETGQPEQDLPELKMPAVNKTVACIAKKEEREKGSGGSRMMVKTLRVKPGTVKFQQFDQPWEPFRC